MASSSAYPLPPAGLRRRVRTDDGVEIEVREWGDPAGPELLLVTGVAQSHLSFAGQYSSPVFAGFRVVAYDPRGHGLSDKPLDPGLYTTGRGWSGELRAVMDATGLKRPVLVGWSMGGRVARQYLVDHGDDRLAGLVFVSARPVEVPEVLGPGNAVLADLRIEDTGSRIAVAAAFLRNCFARHPGAEAFAFALAYNMLCPFEVRQAIGSWQTDPAVSEAALRAVRVPTLVVHGRRDVLVLPRAAEMTAGMVPGARLSWYEDCGHSTFFEDTPRFNAELAAFVRRAHGAVPA